MILPFGEHAPRIAAGAFVAPDATLIGQVAIGAASSVWFGAVLRGDGHSITVGERTNIQDRVVVHVATDRYPTEIGDDVTVGHGAVLHGCTVGNRVLVGIGSIVLDGAHLEDGCMIAAGAVVPPGTRVPSGQVAVGAPAKVVRALRPAETEHLLESAENYTRLAQRYAATIATSGR